MKFKIRTTKTKSGNTAIQVINYVKRKVVILKHIGSAHNSTELKVYKKEAEGWILNYLNENSLFRNEFNEIDTFNKIYKYIDVKLDFAYEFLNKLLS